MGQNWLPILPENEISPRRSRSDTEDTEASMWRKGGELPILPESEFWLPILPGTSPPALLPRGEGRHGRLPILPESENRLPFLPESENRLPFLPLWHV